MPITYENHSFRTLSDILLQGMDDYNPLNLLEEALVPVQRRHGASDYQNVHDIPLEADARVWNNGAWHILKPRFFYGIKSKKKELNETIKFLLELKEPESVDISDEDIRRTLIDPTDNDSIFNVFIMLKIICEKLHWVHPKIASDFDAYHSRKRQEHLNQYEKQLVDSLWPGLAKKELWQESAKISLEDIQVVFQTLQEFIAQVAINSSLQNMAFKIGLAGKKDFIVKNHQGLCDLTVQELEVLKSVLCSLPATKTVYDWLSKHKSTMALTLSSLLGALLEEKPNLEKFLKTLNLEQGSAKSKLNALEREARLAEQERLAKIAEEERVAIANWINVLLLDFLRKTQGYTNTKFHEPLTCLHDQLIRFLLQFRRGEIIKATFKQQSLTAIRHAQTFLAEDQSWSSYLVELANKIRNFFIGFIFSIKEEPHRFFKLNIDAAADMLQIHNAFENTVTGHV